MFKPVKLVKITCIFPRKYLENVVSKLQDLGCVHLTKPKSVGNFKPVKATSHEHKKILKLLLKLDYLIGLIEARTFKPLVTKFFGPRYVYIATKEKHDLKSIGRKLRLLEKKYKDLRFSKKRINLSDYNHLIMLKDLLNDKLEEHNALQLFSRSKYLIRFEGWVENGKALRVKNALVPVAKNACIVSFSEPKHDEEPPTLIRNPKLIEPFEIFTEGYGIPSYREIDPTPIIALTFTFIFGLMFADLGYGLSLSALGILVYLYTTKESSFRRKLNLTLVYLGLSSAFFGFLLGDFFGLHFRKGIVDPVHDILLFFKISILIGLIHASIGLLAKIFSNIKDAKVVLQALSLLLVMWSGLSLYINPNLLLSKILIVVGAVLLLIAEKMGVLKEVFSLMAETLSYIRIAALGIGHIIISRLITSAYNNIKGGAFGFALFIAIFITGSLIILTLGVFVAVVQDLRLHWVEFFPRFFKGKGIKFQPFRHKIAA